MRKVDSDVDGRLEIVGETCTMYPDRGRAPIVARVLGRIVNGGIERIYLDRLIHDAYHQRMFGCDVSGAITTILSRAVSTESPGTAA